MTLKQSVQTLASLAKECVMKVNQSSNPINTIHLQIQHTIYMRDVMRAKYVMDETLDGSVAKQSAIKLIEGHLAELENQLYEAELLERYRSKSV